MSYRPKGKSASRYWHVTIPVRPDGPCVRGNGKRATGTTGKATARAVERTLADL